MRRGTLRGVISPDRILYRDDHLLAVNKLAGELVVAGAGASDRLSLLDFLRKEYPGLRPLHRLDFETSGVVLFARSKQAFEAVRSSKFAGWRKVYLALVEGRPRPQGDIRTPLPSRARPNVVQNGRGEGDVPALTRYKVLDQFANSAFVEAEIQTGRHHQIRKHFAGIGHPLALDHVYGHKGYNRVFTQELGFRQFFLHASRLELPHPVTGEALKIEAPLPKPFESVLKRLRALS